MDQMDQKGRLEPVSDTRRIQCARCKHYFVTWDPNFPKGCRAYGFKSRTMPSQAVLSSSGKPCMSFEEKSAKNGSSA